MSEEKDAYMNLGVESLQYPYNIMLFVVLKWKSMEKERGMAKMIEECLNIKMACLRHDLIGVHLLVMFIKMKI